MEAILRRNVLTPQVNPDIPRTVKAKIKFVGDKLLVHANLLGTRGAEIRVYLYPQGTLPRRFGKLVPKIPPAEPLWNTAILLSPSMPEVIKTTSLPRGKFDALITVDGQPVGAREVTSDPFNGPLLEGIILLGLAISLYYSLRR